MIYPLDLKKQARLIFSGALRAVDAATAVRRAVKISDSGCLTVFDEIYSLNDGLPIYAIALGKAAYPMAKALNDVLGNKLTAGVISGVLPKATTEKFSGKKSASPDKWQMFAGGHPLPNEVSLAAAQSCFELLRLADEQRALVIFLISGGGSAMLEAPRDPSITLADLRETNHVLVSCGAAITEINLVRRTFSLVKGGGLAGFAPRCQQISLIVSDTESGDESSVASGPTIESPIPKTAELISIIERYDLAARLPNSVLNVLRRQREINLCKPEVVRRHYVLLDNKSAVEAAAATARSLGFFVEIAPDISQQNVRTGCVELVRHIAEVKNRAGKNQTVCLISGGEFSCPVRGSGTGGRNSETALQMALLVGEQNVEEWDNLNIEKFVFLSGGTDGIDGNSPAAGAMCDGTTLARARSLGIDARKFLNESDAYSFFDRLDDAVIVGSTGTNVRDVRIILAG